LINIFSEGGGAKVAKEMNVDLLGSIPLDPLVSSDSDSGFPFILNHPDSLASQAFTGIVEKIMEKVKE
jgi:ATP-binding protein involved in chromosome partitioning